MEHNRRSFFQRLAIALGVAVVAPKVISPFPNPLAEAAKVAVELEPFAPMTSVDLYSQPYTTTNMDMSSSIVYVYNESNEVWYTDSKLPATGRKVFHLPKGQNLCNTYSGEKF